MNSAQKISISPHVVGRAVGEEFVILDLASGAYFGLDAVGADMWRLIESGKTLAEICDAVERDYDVARDVLEADARALLDDLAARGLIVLE